MVCVCYNFSTLISLGHNITDYFVVSTSADSEVESLNEIDLPNLGVWTPTIQWMN